jgi:hypothetical protein
MSDFKPMAGVPGLDAVSQSVAVATRSFQAFAGEMQRMSSDAVEQTTLTMEKLRGAKTVEEVVAIQTAHLRNFFSSYVDHARRFNELVMAVPAEFAKETRGAVQQGLDAGADAAHQTADRFGQHQG